MYISYLWLLICVSQLISNLCFCFCAIQCPWMRRASVSTIHSICDMEYVSVECTCYPYMSNMLGRGISTLFCHKPTLIESDTTRGECHIYSDTTRLNSMNMDWSDENKYKPCQNINTLYLCTIYRGNILDYLFICVTVSELKYTKGPVRQQTFVYNHNLMGLATTKPCNNKCRSCNTFS